MHLALDYCRPPARVPLACRGPTLLASRQGRARRWPRRRTVTRPGAEGGEEQGSGWAAAPPLSPPPAPGACEAPGVQEAPAGKPGSNGGPPAAQAALAAQPARALPQADVDKEIFSIALPVSTPAQRVGLQRSTLACEHCHGCSTISNTAPRNTGIPTLPADARHPGRRPHRRPGQHGLGGPAWRSRAGGSGCGSVGVQHHHQAAQHAHSVGDHLLSGICAGGSQWCASASAAGRRCSATAVPY